MPVVIPFVAAAAAAAIDVAAVGGIAAAFASAASIAGVLSAASLGFSIGTLAGSALFPTHTTTTSTGPRIGDLAVQTSTYGAAIPVVFGTDRLSGNIIWSLPIEERAVVTTQTSGGGKKGGKGGSSSNTNTSYTYFGTFAVALCEGVKAGVIKIWANNALVYDASTGTDVIKKTDFNFGFYGGSETQLPDAHIEADKGAGNVPAFRGLCYVVFTGIPLADYGNQLPNLSFVVADEIVWTSHVTALTPGPILGNTAFQWHSISVDYKSNRGFTTVFGGSGHPAGIANFDLKTMVVGRETLWADAITNVYDSVDQTPIAGLDGNLYFYASIATGLFTSDWYLVQFDGDLLSEVIRAFIQGSNRFLSAPFTGSASKVFNSDGTAFDCICTITGDNIDWNISVTRFDAALTVFNSSYISGGVHQGMSVIPGNSRADSSDFLIVNVLNAIIHVRVVKVTNDGVTVTELPEIGPTDVVALNTATASGCSLAGFDRAANLLIINTDVVLSGIGHEYTIAVDATSGDVVWSQPAIGGAFVTSPRYGNVQGTILDGTGAEAFILNTADGGYYSVGTPSPTGTTNYWDSATSSYLRLGSGIDRVFIARALGSTTTLGAICAGISERVGNSAYDTSTIDDILVTGYSLARADTAANDLDTILAGFQVDVIESDFKVIFKARGGSVVASFVEANLVRQNSSDAPEPYKEGWQQSIELPSYLTVTYEDQAIDYQTNTQHAQRVRIVANPTVFSGQTASVQVPIAMDATTALRMADTLLYTTWLNRHTFQVRLPPRYLWLDAGDPVQFTLNGGYTLRARLGKTDLGSDFATDTLLISEVDGQYTSALTIDTVNNFPLTLPTTGPSVLLLLDVPLLRDADEVVVSSSRGYWGASTYFSGTYHGATLFESSDAVNWSQISSVSHATPFGHVETPPPDPTLMWVVETGTSLTVSMANGGSHLVSVTDLDLCNGQNAAVLIKPNGEVELLQYRDVTVLGDERYVLSNLLRGRRGTDTMAFGHVAGETLVLVGAGTTSEISGSISERDVSLWFGAVTAGAVPDPSFREAFTFHARDKMPYAPVDVAILMSGSDVDITWVRRTRLGGALRDLRDAPLSEVSEAYEVDVLTGPSGTVVRTLSSVTTSVLYHAADIVTDFGVLPASLTMRVYQLSEAVGRGFSYEVTLATSDLALASYGTASGAGTATGVGRAIIAAVGAASAAGAATGTGDTAGSTAASAGSGAASGVGGSTAAGVGAAGGAGSSSVVGSNTGSVGSGAGTGDASGVGTSTVAGVGAATGAGDTSGVGSSTAASAGAASGVGDGSGVVGGSTADSVGAAAGAGDSSVVGATSAGSVGAGAGSGSASGVGSDTAASAGSSSGTGAASGAGGSVGAGVGAATGTGSASVVGQAVTTPKTYVVSASRAGVKSVVTTATTTGKAYVTEVGVLGEP